MANNPFTIRVSESPITTSVFSVKSNSTNIHTLLSQPETRASSVFKTSAKAGNVFPKSIISRYFCCQAGAFFIDSVTLLNVFVMSYPN